MTVAKENKYAQVCDELRKSPRRWLITGCAGFIGSNLLESLLKLDQGVVGLDNFATGYQRNLDDVQSLVSEEQWDRFTFFEGDIRDLSTCHKVCDGVDIILHQAALGSVPRSIEDPITSNSANVTGFLNMLVAARDAKVSRFVYAASSSTYGDHPGLPKVEDKIGKPLSPYAVTKYVNELYAHVFWLTYGLESVGLRYFNVFGCRQSPTGAYAAVIPKWFGAILSGSECVINGDGSTSRDFCYVANVVQANILSAASSVSIDESVFNIAVGDKTTLNTLFSSICDQVGERLPEIELRAPVYKEFRKGDVLHSQADISRASSVLGYSPTHTVTEGLKEAAEWYVEQSKSRASV